MDEEHRSRPDERPAYAGMTGEGATNNGEYAE